MEVIMNKNQKDGNLKKTLDSRVKKLRQEMNLTQAEVADALHVTPGYISNVENNRYSNVSSYPDLLCKAYEYNTGFSCWFSGACL